MREIEGLTLRELAHTTAMAYQFALGDKDPSWPLPDGSEEAWTDTIALCIPMVERVTSFTEAAKFGLDTFANMIGSTVHWEDAPVEIRIAWEAVARHLVNMLDIDDDDKAEKHEGYWLEWAKNKKSKLVQTSA